MRTQYMFNPIDFGFEWSGDWYVFDYERASKAALAARSKRAKELKARGCKVGLYTLKNQLITKGGIGSNHPEISQIVNVYVLLA